MVTNSSSSDRPVITSGITSGAVVSPENSVRPLNGPNRASAMPASVPSATAIVAEIAATRRLSHAALRIWSFCSSAPYHLVENPPHTVTSFDALNEYTISDTIGM
jgi:hypothetical protein